MLANNHLVDVLIPTYDRPDALAVTMTSLAAQTFQDWRLIISDQGNVIDAASSGVVKAAASVLNLHRHQVEIHKHLPRRGMAEQRQFLLDQVHAPYALYLDDDLILEPWVIANLVKAMQEENCGFVGNSVIGLSYINDYRPFQQKIEFWDGPIKPELIEPESEKWYRYELHNAANLLHVQQKLRLEPDTIRKYKVAWVAVCVLYDVEKLRSIGGYKFWEELPDEHSGEDVLAQLRVMAKYGGCGLIPSGVYHLELPTTIPVREVDAPKVLNLFEDIIP